MDGDALLAACGANDGLRMGRESSGEMFMATPDGGRSNSGDKLHPMEFALSSLALPLRLRPELPMSDGELLRFSRENRPLRMEREPNGEILIITPAGFRTSKMNQRIVRFLAEWAEADGRGEPTGSDGGYNLPDGSVRAPDAGWLSFAKVAGMTDAQQDGFPPVCPEFVIELRSPSDRLLALREKMVMWLANGAEIAWLIDPLRRAVEVYRAGEAPEIHENPTRVLGTGCVSGFCLVMERVWS